METFLEIYILIKNEIIYIFSFLLSLFKNLIKSPEFLSFIPQRERSYILQEMMEGWGTVSILNKNSLTWNVLNI